MDHVGVVVGDREAAISFFVELGMELDGGTTPVQGDRVDRVVSAQAAPVAGRSAVVEPGCTGTSCHPLGSARTAGKSFG
jgi:catechol 2,3-dioxygenase-like lactoylglutathione lyase family enzyme